MGIALGSTSYVAFKTQVAWGTAETTSLTTAPFLRTSPVLQPRTSRMPRASTVATMPKVSQMWDMVDLCDVDIEFEWIAHATAWLPWFTAAWGRRNSSVATPNVHKFNIHNPATGDADVTGVPPDDYYHRGLTVVETLGSSMTALTPFVSEVGTYRAHNVCVNQMQITMEANAPLRMKFTGVGEGFQEATQIAWADLTGSLGTWKHLNATANGGLYVGVADPAATAILANTVVFTLDSNLRFVTQLGSAAGADLRLPVRTGYPNAMFEFDMDFSDETSGMDAAQLMTDFIGNTANNVRAEYYIDANNSLELTCGGSVDSCLVEEPRFNPSGDGIVGFSFTLKCYPDTMTDAAVPVDDLEMNLVTAT